jgi:hypothetical protein
MLTKIEGGIKVDDSDQVVDCGMIIMIIHEWR